MVDLPYEREKAEQSCDDTRRHNAKNAKNLNPTRPPGSAAEAKPHHAKPAFGSPDRTTFFPLYIFLRITCTKPSHPKSQGFGLGNLQVPPRTQSYQLRQSNKVMPRSQPTKTPLHHNIAIGKPSQQPSACPTNASTPTARSPAFHLSTVCSPPNPPAPRNSTTNAARAPDPASPSAGAPGSSSRPGTPLPRIRRFPLPRAR